ncbi:c-type cytochrome [Oricola cellulosilytica]|nr:cytochrome c [Oricola cellulosilytica]
MRKSLFVLSMLAVSGVTAVASEDPVATRKALMQSNGAAAGLSGGMMKGEIPYNAAAAKAALASFNAAATAFGDYFPEGSDMDANTTASPKIWEDMEGFEAELDKFQTAAAAAMQAAGKDGPADLDAFKAAAGSVLGTCKDCHEGYRVKN